MMMTLPDGAQFGEVTNLGTFTNVIYIDGCPFKYGKVKRFIQKGVGIRLGDEVAYVAEPDGSLSYLKNVVYLTEDEKVKHGFTHVKGVKQQMVNRGPTGSSPSLVPRGFVINDPELIRVMQNFQREKSVYRIGVTINLANYENIRVEIEGPDFDFVRAELIESLRKLATDPALPEHEAIERYIDRVLT